MIKLRHQQPRLWTVALREEVEDLWEPWIREVDRLLEDEALVDSVYGAESAVAGARHGHLDGDGADFQRAGIGSIALVTRGAGEILLPLGMAQIGPQEAEQLAQAEVSETAGQGLSHRGGQRLRGGIW